MTSEFWNGKRVLLTGHTGFKGAWLSLFLEKLGARVTGLALAPDQNPSLFEIAGVDRGLRSIIGDIRDLPTVERAVIAAEPDIVIHMAAQALVRRGYREPVETYATNVLGTVHVLDAVRRLSKARACVVVTSDKCYENREWLWPYREDEPMGGRDPYSNSKGCAELVVSAYRSSYFAPAGIGLASARAGNVVGGGDWSEDRLIPDLFRGFIDGKPTLIRQPDSIRPWQHVLEAISGYLLLVERLWSDPDLFAQGWNFGPPDVGAVPVQAIADTLVARWGDGAYWIRDSESGVHEANVLKLDSTKARTLLSWKPKLTVEQSLDWIVKWYRAYVARADMRNFTTAQIEEYEARDLDA
ncbi:CDP-glucose 4,6-dehydratase [Bradyrhizobium sp. UFLA05-153]